MVKKNVVLSLIAVVGLVAGSAQAMEQSRLQKIGGFNPFAQLQQAAPNISLNLYINYPTFAGMPAVEPQEEASAPAIMSQEEIAAYRQMIDAIRDELDFEETRIVNRTIRKYENKKNRIDGWKKLGRKHDEVNAMEDELNRLVRLYA